MRLLRRILGTERLIDLGELALAHLSLDLARPFTRITSYNVCYTKLLRSAVCEIFFDVRINPRTSPAAVKAQFAEFVAELSAAHPELELDWEMYGSAPGGTTDPQNWIIQSAKRGWEHIEQRPHGMPDLLGGQTDRNNFV